MKNQLISKLLRFLISPLLISTLLFSCKKDKQADAIDLDNKALKPKTSADINQSAALATSNQDLIAYKNSAHALMMGYYRTWGDVVTDPVRYKTKMTDLPDSLDIVSVFTDFTPPTNPFWKTLKDTYIPALHAKGTKVIYTSMYFKGASTNPTGLANWVKGINDSISKYNYDGWDLDIEETSSGTTLQDQIACFRALSKYLGPLSGTGKLLIYDTNQNGNALMSAIKDMVNYVFLQAYWRSVTSLQGTYNTYSNYIGPSKFLVGVSFEDGTGYRDNQMPAYAAWNPTQGRKGGAFAYGIDMEGPNSGRNFRTTRAAISKMNPPKNTATGTGVTLYQNCSFGGWSATFAEGDYTLSQLMAKGAKNDDVSSIKVPSGYTAVLYTNDNFSGSSIVINGDNSCLVSNSFNDKVSSIKVAKN